MTVLTTPGKGVIIQVSSNREFAMLAYISIKHALGTSEEDKRPEILRPSKAKQSNSQSKRSKE
jgi:hypothetical protein